ncbi:hypothetical protein Q765_14740 [Flavobacterium rivuli WB 3.3-2 = DSM 21788]|uniref:Uncharacterized protein n=1 Tax=Flavobacterium rivuli WB 3.3-2 = DSM 21788 TaxID=1121895 RepID=A0A0A2M0B7_9FLAO|nr:hypothetical protein [Flavobacterium rivuli]KGO85679.1 hypothetical protein Q765_14740 [Flavobacterium rivuli WB 3.3-2 = DSM 21788]
MLTKGLRDEENERINNVLKQLTALTFVPEGWSNADADVLLQKLGLSIEALTKIDANELNHYLVRFHLDWANMEQFADVLARLSANAGLDGFKAKAVALYNFIQQESKMMSFGIMGKISALSK